MNGTLTALIMSLAAGLATGLGGLAVFFDKRASKVFISAALGFSAGVMFFVALCEIYPSAQAKLASGCGVTLGGWLTLAAFFGGMLVIALIEKLMPSAESSFGALGPRENGASDAGLVRTGVLTAVAIAVHNFPEGLATFVSALEEPSVAIPVVVAVAIHNIPEGIAVAIPLYRAFGSKPRAFLFALLSGLAEPVGALIGMLVLMPIMTDAAFGTVFAVVAGIMTFISIDELLPSARIGSPTASTVGTVVGMAVMAVSLTLL